MPSFRDIGHCSGNISPSGERRVGTTIVRATCQRCGDVEMGPEHLELRLAADPRHSTYVFTCPSCETLVIKPAADARVRRALLAVGVRSVEWSFPAELDEVHRGSPLTEDDLIDLMLLLEQPDWALRLSASPSRR